MKNIIAGFCFIFLISCGNNTNSDQQSSDSAVIVPNSMGDTGNAGTSGSGNASGMQNANDKDNNYGNIQTNSPDSGAASQGTDSTANQQDTTNQ